MNDDTIGMHTHIHFDSGRHEFILILAGTKLKFTHCVQENENFPGVTYPDATIVTTASREDIEQCDYLYSRI